MRDRPHQRPATAARARVARHAARGTVTHSPYAQLPPVILGGPPGTVGDRIAAVVWRWAAGIGAVEGVQPELEWPYADGCRGPCGGLEDRPPLRNRNGGHEVTPELQEVLELLLGAQAAPTKTVEGATDEELMQLEQDLGRPLPEELRTWLEACKGSVAGPGSLYGVGNEAEWLNISYHVGLNSSWRQTGLIPVAGDGAGNTYVLDTRIVGNPIGFVEEIEDPEEIQYYCASGFMIFLRELLLDYISDTAWPFDRDYIARVDPGLLSLHPQPWEE